jgi:hypothetical protein
MSASEVSEDRGNQEGPEPEPEPEVEQADASAKYLGKPVGRIHECLEYWRDNFEHDGYAMRVVREGFRIPVRWAELPKVYEEPDNQSALKNYDFVLRETERLVQEGQVVLWPHKPRFTNPLTVAVNNRPDGSVKLRMVLDLSRGVNPAIPEDRYKMATLQDALDGTRRGDYQLTFDLKSAFHHLKLHPSCYELMGFAVTGADKVKKYYCYVVLVFGLCVAAQALGRLLKPLCKFLASNGVPLVLYIDDGRVTGPTKEEAGRRFKFALKTLKAAGWQISYEKSFTPEQAAQRIEFLGVEIDSVGMNVFAPKAKLEKIKEILKKVVNGRAFMKIKELASIVGKFIALEKAFGPAVLVGTRMATIQIDEAATQYSWKGSVHMSEDTRAALRRVLTSVDEWNGFPIRTAESEIALTSILADEPEEQIERKIPNRRLFGGGVTIASDASDDMVASYGLNGKLKDFAFVQELLPHEKGLSSTHREISAVHKTLLCRGEELRMKVNTTLWWLTDNRNVQFIFAKGSNSLEIMRQTLQILELARSLNLDIQPVWVSRDDPRIQKADCMTKQVNSDDWSIYQDAFQELKRWAGEFTVDLFASGENNKVEKYYTYSFVAGCAGVDAFVHNWSHEVVYCAPPVSLILRVVRKIEKSVVTGVLLVPIWRGAKFWLPVFEDGRHLNGVFSVLRKLRIKTTSWSASPKDAFAGKWVWFLALKIESKGIGFIGSVVKRDRCFRRLFGKECTC